MPRSLHSTPGPSRLKVVAEALSDPSASEDDLNNFSEDSGENAEDRPRIAQWEDDPDDLSMNPRQTTASSIPFTARLKRSQLKHTDVHKSPANSDDEDEEFSDTSSSSSHAEPSRKSSKLDGPSREKKVQVSKRANKHAPVEMSSKRPVSRRRVVVEVKTVQPRDPRFLPLSGEFNAKSFHSGYGFLSELHTTERDTLKESLKRAKKLLKNSPRALLAEREAEVERLERALKTAESSVNRDRREKIEREALERIERDEKDKRKQGKGAWYMGSAEKKDTLLRARHDALLASGGRQAIKKAIEKRQKKVAQKEKRSRPDMPTRGETVDSSGRKRRRVA